MMLKNARFHFLTLLLLVILTTAVSGVCGRPQPRLLRAEYSQSDAVVIATLLRSEHVEPKEEQDYHLYTFRVDKKVRGAIPVQFVLFDENSTGRLTFDLRRGHQFLLFVNRWQPREKGKDWWTADGCGHSGDVLKSRESLDDIEGLSSLTRGLIAGEVVSGVDAVGNVRVVATSKTNGKHFEAKTRTDGGFSLTVPPGEYSVAIEAKAKTYVAGDLSYEDPKSVKLEKGGCAQIEFVESDSAKPR